MISHSIIVPTFMILDILRNLRISAHNNAYNNDCKIDSSIQRIKMDTTI